MGSRRESISKVADNNGDSSSTSKFKKVFLKKRVDNSKEDPTTSSKLGESSSSFHRKVTKLQKLRRKVRKTYPLMEIQQSNMKAPRESQRYARAYPADELPEANENDDASAAELGADNLSDIFEALGNKAISSPHSEESSDVEEPIQIEEDDSSSCSYEASNSLPHPLASESPVFGPYQTQVVDCFDLDSTTSTNDNNVKLEEDKEKSYVYIDTSELFERPNLDGMGLQNNHLAPCLSPSENDDDAERKLSAQIQGENRFISIPPNSSTRETGVESGNMRIKASSFHYCDPYFPTLMQDSIRELALDGHFTDVTIEVDSHRMKCHKMILAASSKYFKAMFCNNYRERNQDSVKIEAVPAAMMKVLIRYAYTSYLEITCDNVQNVLEAASLLQFTRVMEACSNYFAGELAIENAPGIMELAQRHNLKHLLVLARLKCVTCFEELREKSDYQTLSASSLESLISRNDLMVSQEEEVFRVIMEWCQYDEESRKKHLPQLLQHLKMPLIDEIYFVREVETHPLIKNNPHVFDLLMEARLFRVSSVLPSRERLVPRHNANMHQVFVTVGGCNKNDDFVNDVTMLDFQHKTRATLCHLPNSKKNPRKESDKDSDEKATKWAEFGCIAWKGNVVVSGGKETKKEVWMFITTLRQWVELGSLSTARWRHRMAVCGGAMYAVGGYDGLLRIDSLEKYSEKENRWHEKRPMREGVSSAAVCDCNEKIYVIGGGPSVKVSSDKVQVYNPVTDSWALQTSMPEPAKCISAVSLSNMIYVAGGTLNYVLTFDARSKIWTTIGDALACERASCGMTLCNDMVFIVGGRDDEGKAISNVSYLDPKTKLLRSECNLAFGISHHGCLTLQKYDNLKIKSV